MTKFVALFRGINVGGNNKVEMPKLKKVLESLGFSDVVTYINSGNVLFETGRKDTDKLVLDIEKIVAKTFGFTVRVVLRDAKNIQKLCAQIPADWKNDAEQRTDVMFLWDKYDSRKSLDLIKADPKVDVLRYFPGAIVWHLDRKDYKKSKLHNFIGSELYKNITIRNLNTLRKLNELMKN